MERKADISVEGRGPRERDAFRRELDSFLDRAGDATTWRPERVVKQSDFETTEFVLGTPRGSRPGRYVRKVIDTGSGAGAAYEELWAAQGRGISLPCAPRLVECERRGGSLTVVMEYVDGCTVDAVVASLGAGPDIAARVMPALCRSVQELHTCLPAPLIHRDLKPSNVIMRDGGAVIIDFGCARTWRPEAESDTTHFLTRCYAPPEQFGFGQTDERTDVYALGKILYYCLTGEQPPNLCDGDVCSGFGVDPSLARVVARACSFDPGARYGSAAELGQAIEEALSPLIQASAAVGASGAPVGAAMAARCDRASSGAGDSRLHGSPARVLAGLRAGVARLASRVSALVPGWVGIVWNAVVLLFLAGMVWQSFDTLANPPASDAGLPFAYLLFRNVCYIDPIMAIVAYLLLDRRRLRARFPVLARASIARETVYGVVALGALTFASVLVISLAGW